MKLNLLNKYISFKKNLLKVMRLTSVILCIFTVKNVLAFNFNDFKNMFSKNNTHKDDNQIIPIQTLFSKPDYVSVRLSYDGKHISFLSPKDNVLNVWVGPIEDIKKARQVTFEPKRSIRSYSWSYDNENIIYTQDTDGDENWYLRRVNIKTMEDKVLTPTDKTRSFVLHASEKIPNKLLILSSKATDMYNNIYELDINTGEMKLVYQNEGRFTSFVADDDFKIRFTNKVTEDNTGNVNFYLTKNGDLNDLHLLKTVKLEDLVTTYSTHISSDGKKMFMISTADSNTQSLIEVHLDNFEEKILYNNPNSDISDFLLDQKTKEIQGIETEYTRKEWKFFDDHLKEEFEYLTKNIAANSDITIVSRDSKDIIWIIAVSRSDKPTKYFLYDRLNKQYQFLFYNNTKHVDLDFAVKYPIIIQSRDKKDLTAYLTIPKEVDVNNNGIPNKKVPLIMNIHGGPNARDSWGFSPSDQFLANRGYAVLRVNYRGSTGFGKEFINLGNGEWGRKMQEDILDCVEWAVKNNITSKDTVAIMGGSYGGYATLVGMTMNSDVFAAGIDIVGPSNLETLLNSIPAYWKPHIKHLTTMLGSTGKTEEEKAFLKSRSPLYHVENIKKPLLIIQGANDPRVKQNESDQIVNAMIQKNIPVTYLLYPDEGHGVVRHENNLSMFAFIEEFLHKTMKGKIENRKNNIFEGSTVQIKHDNLLNK